MEKIVIRTVMRTLVVLLTSVVMLSCGSDDEPEENKGTAGMTGKEAQLLGSWEVTSNPKKGYQETFYLTFFTKGKVVRCWINTGKYSLHEWTYNDATEILAITVPFQCQLTHLSDNAWTGIYLGNSSWSVMAEREESGDTTLKAIFESHGLWLSKDGRKELPIEYKYGDIYLDYSGRPYRGKLIESRKDDTITLEGFTVHHPYDFENVYVEDADGECYYPVDDLFD